MNSLESASGLLPIPARPRRASIAARLIDRPALWLPALWLAALLFYLPTSLHPDVSWYLVATERFIDGARLYRDIIEVNPPLAFYLTVPPVAAARELGLSSGPVFILYVFLLVAFSLGLVDRLLRQTPGMTARGRGGLLLAILGAFVVLPLPVFGEREHLMLIFAVPYILLVGRRLTGRSCAASLAVIIGLAAAIGFGLKPYFALVPVLLELYLIGIRRSLYAVFRPESLSLLAGTLAYLALALTANSEYFSFVVPYALLVYGAYSSPLLSVLTRPGVVTLLLPICALALARAAHATDRQTHAFALAGVGFFVGYVVQCKGWDYQLLPTIVTIFLATAQILVALLEHPPAAALPRRRQLIIWSAAALATLAMPAVMRGPSNNPFTERMLPIVQKYASGGAIYAFSSHVWVGFPLVNEAGVQWSSRFPTQWLLPGAHVQLAQAENLEPQKARKLREIEQYVTDATVLDFERWPPDLVIVDTDNPYMREANFDYLAFFERDARFARLWQPYVKIGAVPLEIGASPLNDGTMRVFDIWCRRTSERPCVGLTIRD
jgi:hypothetical protein